jgi:hypothetical protein
MSPFAALRLATIAAALVFAAGACGPSTTALRTRKLLARGDYERAERTLHRALGERPRDGELLGLQLQLQLARGKPASALAIYRSNRNKQLLKRYAIAAIWAAMRHQDPEIRLAGVHAARQADVAELIREMARRLSDPDGRVRSWAAVALSTLPAGADALQKQLRAPDARARAIAIAEVGRIAKGKAYETVIRFVGDKSPLARAAAARGLSYSGRQQAVPLLVKLSQDEDKRVRLAAVSALGKLGFTGARKALRQRLRDPYLPVRMAALDGYTVVAGEDALPYLRETAGGKNMRLALHAGRILARKKNELQPVLDAIAKALVDKRWSVRASGVNMASIINDKVAWSLGLKGLRDAEPAVRLATVRLLRNRKLEAKKANRATAALFALLCSDKKPADLEAGPFSRCVQAAELSAQIGTRRGKRKLAKLAAEGKRWQSRAQALRAGLRHAASAALAMIGLGDAQPRVNLIAAVYVYRKLR